MHSSKTAQIVHLKVDEAPTKVSSQYADFADVFSPKLAIKLSKHIKINDYTIKLVDDQELQYGPIYSLGPVELKILKNYIENNLTNGFIRPFKFPTEALIFFDKKSDKNLILYVDYDGLNNLIIKNWYLLTLIGKSLDRLGRAQCFTQLKPTNAYYRIQIREGDK